MADPLEARNRAFALGRWITTQRRKFKKATLPPDRAGQLQALPGWAWDTPDARWEDAYHKLVQFIERERHARVLADGSSLGAWVAHQRKLMKKGVLARDRQERLEALPAWVWDRREDRWDDAYKLLAEYVDRTGTARVPTSHKESGFALGAWVAAQRMRMADGSSGLELSRRERLRALPGWVTDARQAAWDDGYTRLVRYVEREGNAKVPAAFVTHDGFKLGVWVGTQRQRNKAGFCDPARQKRLEALQGWTWQDTPKRRAGIRVNDTSRSSNEPS